MNDHCDIRVRDTHVAATTGADRHSIGAARDARLVTASGRPRPARSRREERPRAYYGKSVF
jgi:hypothetical protein